MPFTDFGEGKYRKKKDELFPGYSMKFKATPQLKSLEHQTLPTDLKAGCKFILVLSFVEHKDCDKFGFMTLQKSAIVKSP